MDLKPDVGTVTQHTRTCDRYRPIYYAGASGDFNPLHFDKEFADFAGLGGVILQGLCTLAWAVEAGLTLTSDPGKLKRVRVRFSRPVRPEDTIRFETRVQSIQDGRLHADITARNDGGEEVLKGASVEIEVD